MSQETPINDEANEQSVKHKQATDKSTSLHVKSTKEVNAKQANAKETVIPEEFLENEYYSQMKNNVVSQLSRMYEILNHAGKFKKFYNELNNITDSLNNNLNAYITNSKHAILCDIYDGLMESIDFEAYKNKLQTDIKSHGNLSVPKYKHVDFDLDEFTIDLYDTDVYTNMLDVLDESTVKKFAKFQNDAKCGLHDLLGSVSSFEEDLCNFRTNKIAEMMKNIDTFYAIHVNYAKHCLKLKKANKNVDVQNISIDNVSIPIVNSQKQFIGNCLKALIGL